MKVIPTFNKASISLLMLALVAGIAGCSQEQATDTMAEEVISEASSGLAYVTSQKSDTAGVSVIDLATMEVVNTFDVKAEGPRG